MFGLGNYQVDLSTLPPAPQGYAYGPTVGPSGVSLVKLPPNTLSLLGGLVVIAAGAFLLFGKRMVV